MGAGAWSGEAQVYKPSGELLVIEIVREAVGDLAEPFEECIAVRDGTKRFLDPDCFSITPFRRLNDRRTDPEVRLEKRIETNLISLTHQKHFSFGEKGCSLEHKDKRRGRAFRALLKISPQVLTPSAWSHLSLTRPADRGSRTEMRAMKTGDGRTYAGDFSDGQTFHKIDDSLRSRLDHELPCKVESRLRLQEGNSGLSLPSGLLKSAAIFDSMVLLDTPADTVNPVRRFRSTGFSKGKEIATYQFPP